MPLIRLTTTQTTDLDVTPAPGRTTREVVAALGSGQALFSSDFLGNAVVALPDGSFIAEVRSRSEAPPRTRCQLLPGP